MDDCCTVCCGGCAACGLASLAAFCNTKTYGANGCCRGNSTSGCCGSCFKSSFNEDNFEQELQRDMDKTRASNVGNASSVPAPSGSGGGGIGEVKEVKTEQPKSTPGMELGSGKVKQGLDEAPKEVVPPG